MEKKNKGTVLRILTAICFLWLPVNGAMNFISGKIYESGDILAIVVGALPFIAGIFVVIGALLGSRVVIGLGAVIYVLQAGYSIYVYIMQMLQNLPDEAKKSFRSLILVTALMLLAFLFLALACFVKRSDLALCIFTIALFVGWFFVRRGQIAADASQLPLILTAAGSVLGTILLALFFAVRKDKKEA